jgi:hypothetical protein
VCVREVCCQIYKWLREEEVINCLMHIKFIAWANNLDGQSYGGITILNDIEEQTIKIT